MTDLPINKDIKLRCIPNIPHNNNLVKSVGGMYVSAKLGMNMPIQTAAQVPGFFEYQTWKFGEPTKEGVQILFIPHEEESESNDIGPLGFHNDSEAPGTPVTLGAPSYYSVEVKTEIRGGKIVVIRPTGDLVGMDYYVGVGLDRQLEIQAFPIGTTEGLPGWYFHG